MTDLEPIQAKLRSFARSKPNAIARAVVGDGLASKSEGTQSLALKVLGAWGDRKSIEQLKLFLKSAYDRKYGWPIGSVAIDALIPNIVATHIEWVRDLYGSRDSGLEQYELRYLIKRAEEIST